MRWLWRKIRTAKMGGWNPLYSPALHFHEIIKGVDMRQAFLDGITEDLAEKRRRQLDR